MFDYSIHVKIVPSELKRGKRAKITAVVTNPNKKVAYCVSSIKGYNMQQKLEPAGNSTFSLTIGLPVIVPRGVYLLETYAVSEDNEKGPICQTEVELV